MSRGRGEVVTYIHLLILNLILFHFQTPASSSHTRLQREKLRIEIDEKMQF